MTIPAVYTVPPVRPPVTRFGDGRIYRVRDDGALASYIAARDAFVDRTTPLLAGTKRAGAAHSRHNSVRRINYDTKQFAMVTAVLTGDDNAAFHGWLRDHASQKPSDPTLERFYTTYSDGKPSLYAFAYNDMVAFMMRHLAPGDQDCFNKGQPVTSDLGTTYQIETIG
ncbi:MAG: hypothetical protein KC475_05170 [Cyanobacteria bacterium HKST-UBA03]|nr:hypothetical protein [Cyanobacteria bacterium HKST-UBA03]